MKNKIIKLVSFVMMGVMMFGNSVAFAVHDEDPNLLEITIDTVTASCYSSPPNPWRTPVSSFDDDANTAWVTGTVEQCNGNYVQYEDPNTGIVSGRSWIKFDLGSEKTFSRFHTWPLANNVNVNYIIQASNDDVVYQDIGNIEATGVKLSQNSGYHNTPGGGISTFTNGRLNQEFFNYRYIRLLDNDSVNGMGVTEIDIYYDSSLNSASVPEFSTYIYLTTLALILALGYRRLPEFMKEKN